MNAIEYKQISKAYPGFTLGPFDLTLPQGAILGLIGENGAGKSTLIKLTLGLLQPDAGSVSVLGDAIPDKNKLGVVLDDVGISECLTPQEVGRIMALSYDRWDMDRYNALLKQFSLPTDKKFKTFSRGMRMKLGIAVALSHNASLLLFDEATAGLDPVIRDEILDLLLDFTRDETHSVLLSSHIVSDLEKICDYIAFVHEGRLLLLDEKDALREKYALVPCTRETLDALPREAIVGKRGNAYGYEVIIRRDALPAGMNFSPVDLEQLFILMTKEDRA